VATAGNVLAVADGVVSIVGSDDPAEVVFSLLAALLGLALTRALVPVLRVCWSSRGLRAVQAARGRSGPP
jgi:hypothetical protein